jgi:hypothetical protein
MYLLHINLVRPLPHRMRHKTLRKSLLALKTEFNIATIIRHISGAKKKIPKGERQAEICAISVRHLFGMMPHVHLRIIENVAQHAERQFYICMIEMPPSERENMNDKKIVQTHANQRKRQISNRFIHNRFHKMVAQMRRKRHRFGAVMHLMKVPKRRHTVQQAVRPPFYKILEYKHQQQNLPVLPRAEFYRYQIFYAKCCLQTIIEYRYKKCRNRIVANQRKQEIVEKHIKYVQPKILTEFGLLGTPRRKGFRSEKKQRNEYQPVEIIFVPRLIIVLKRNFRPQIIGVALVAIDENFYIVHLEIYVILRVRMMK